MIVDLSGSEYDYGVTDPEEEDKEERYASNAKHFAEAHPKYSAWLEDLIQSKRKLAKGQSKHDGRREYTAWVRDSCKNYFDPKRLVSAQKQKAKLRYWKEFKKSKFGPLRYMGVVCV